MNTLNKILIMLLILYLINHLTEGRLLNTFNYYINMCRRNVESFIGLKYNNIKGITTSANQQQKDLDDDDYRLYQFMDNLIAVNTNMNELTGSHSRRILADASTVDEILNQLDKILNHHGFTFNNIKLLDKIYYYENPRGKEIESFNISADVYYKNKLIGSVIMNFETFLREDRFKSNQMKYGLLTITNVRLINRRYPNNMSKTKSVNSVYKLEPSGAINSPTQNQQLISEPMRNTNEQNKAIMKTQELANKMSNSFNNHFVNRDVFDDLFIKPNKQHVTEGFMNDTENSLIPSIVEFSAYEATSDNQTSN